MNNVVTQRFINCHDKLKAENRIRSSRQFAISLEYLPQSLSEILKGRRDVTIDLLRKAVELYHLNAHYLISGEGPLLLDEPRSGIGGSKEIRIPHVPATLFLHYAKACDSPSWLATLPFYTLPDMHTPGEVLRSFEVPGNTLFPMLNMGDKVICQQVPRAEWANAIQASQLYVLMARDSLYCCRLHDVSDHPQQLQVFLDTSMVPTMQLPYQEVQELWRANAKIAALPALPLVAPPSVQDTLGQLVQVVETQTQLIQELHAQIKQLK